MSFIPRDKVPYRSKFGPKTFNLGDYINLTKFTNTCKTGGFFYGIKDSWLSKTHDSYYPSNILNYNEGLNGYIYNDTMAIYDVNIPESYFIKFSKVIPGGSYTDKIILIEDDEDMIKFGEAYTSPKREKVYFAGEEISNCFVDWDKVIKVFGGFETRIIDKSSELVSECKTTPEKCSWASWWYVESGVIWNLKLIKGLKIIEHPAPNAKKIFPKGVYTVLSKSNFIDLNKFFEGSKLIFNGSKANVIDDNLYMNILSFHKDKYDEIVIVNSRDLPRNVSKHVNMIRKRGAPGIFFEDLDQGILWDVSAIKDIKTVPI